MSNEVIIGSIIALITGLIVFWYGLKKGIKSGKEGTIFKFSKTDKILAVISFFLFLFVAIFLFR